MRSTSGRPTGVSLAGEGVFLFVAQKSGPTYWRARPDTWLNLYMGIPGAVGRCQTRLQRLWSEHATKRELRPLVAINEDSRPPGYIYAD